MHRPADRRAAPGSHSRATELERPLRASLAGALVVAGWLAAAGALDRASPSAHQHFPQHAEIQHQPPDADDPPRFVEGRRWLTCMLASEGPTCRCRSFSDFFSASRMKLISWLPRRRTARSATDQLHPRRAEKIREPAAAAGRSFARRRASEPAPSLTNRGGSSRSARCWC